MKELSIEQKAQAYDEIVEATRRIYNNMKEGYNFGGTEDLETIETEDERIRNGIIRNLGYLMDRAEGFVKDELKERIAWLEKQGDKDSHVKLPTFTFDDILALQCCMETIKKVQNDKDLYEQLNNLHGRVYDAYHLEKNVEQEPIEWSEEDEKNLRQVEYACMKFFGGDCSLIGWLRKSLKERTLFHGRRALIEGVCEWLDDHLGCYIVAQDFTIEYARLDKDLVEYLENES